jgi:hypothetical protein
MIRFVPIILSPKKRSKRIHACCMLKLATEVIWVGAQELVRAGGTFHRVSSSLKRFLSQIFKTQAEFLWTFCVSVFHVVVVSERIFVRSSVCVCVCVLTRKLSLIIFVCYENLHSSKTQRPKKPFENFRFVFSKLTGL